VLALAVGLVTVAAVSAPGEIPQKVVMRVKPSVVKIEAANSVAFGMESSGTKIGTGFVVDAERGIVATSAHVVVSSPAQLRVTFHDGESTAARLLHHDAWHDFALIELERDADARWTATAAVLGDSFALHDQQELFLVGSNEGQEQSVKFGRVTNLVVNKGRRHRRRSRRPTGGSTAARRSTQRPRRNPHIRHRHDDFELRISTCAMPQAAARQGACGAAMSASADLILVAGRRGPLPDDAPSGSPRPGERKQATGELRIWQRGQACRRVMCSSKWAASWWPETCTEWTVRSTPASVRPLTSSSIATARGSSTTSRSLMPSAARSRASRGSPAACSTS
jgi:hypothetical protein